MERRKLLEQNVTEVQNHIMLSEQKLVKVRLISGYKMAIVH